MELPLRKTKIIETLSKCEDFGNPEQHYESLLQLKKDFTLNPEKKKLCDILEGLGSTERLLILDTLAEKDRCICELEVILAKAQPSISHHIKVLEDAGLIRGWKKGKFTHYSLVKRQIYDFKSIMVEWLDKIDNWFEELPEKNQKAKLKVDA
ncbi:MAG TPA: metalloregulator ArsR/SmtB family transcription factor [Candidatus Lokiarchaeia archaeon]|nr:metalloregulator ArsR/SmtB family transcription factor [Candidatus Lokiarchaeia archaeon]